MHFLLPTLITHAIDIDAAMKKSVQNSLNVNIKFS